VKANEKINEMNHETKTQCPARLARVALLRRALLCLARGRGRFRGHVIRRIIYAVGRLPLPSRLRVLNPIQKLIDLIPSVHTKASSMGLGLAGGGGGSSGLILRQICLSTKVQMFKNA